MYIFVLIGACRHHSSCTSDDCSHDLLRDYPKETRLGLCPQKYHDAVSKHKVNIPTPVMAGVRNTLASICIFVFSLMLMTPSIVSLAALWLLNVWPYVSTQGLVSALTQAGFAASTCKIRGGEVQHTGVVPFLKKFESNLSDALKIHKTTSEVV